MEAFSTVEPVTGMLNKRGFTELLPDTLHKLRKQNKAYSVLFISQMSDSSDSAYDMALITANALKNVCTSELCGRLTSDIFAVIISTDNEAALKDTAVYLSAKAEDKITVPQLVFHKR